MEAWSITAERRQLVTEQVLKEYLFSIVRHKNGQYGLREAQYGERMARYH